MIKYGCVLRDHIPYADACRFLNQIKFDFFQFRYEESGLCLYGDENFETVLKYETSGLLHAVLDIHHIQDHLNILEMTKQLGVKDLIVHPVCLVSDINNQSVDILIKQLKLLVNAAKKDNIIVHLENNGQRTPIFASLPEYQKVLDAVEGLEFLIDLAHVVDVVTLKEMVAIKYPKILHVADRRKEIVHEHLRVGSGDFDFDYAFKEILHDFNGKIIIEIAEDDDLIYSKGVIQSLIQGR